MAVEAKPVSVSRLVLAQMMTPQDANVYGNVHGGNIMRLADATGPRCAPRSGDGARNSGTEGETRGGLPADVNSGYTGTRRKGGVRETRGRTLTRPEGWEGTPWWMSCSGFSSGSDFS